jgi:hypothetical protein
MNINTEALGELLDEYYNFRACYHNLNTSGVEWLKDSPEAKQILSRAAPPFPSLSEQLRERNPYAEGNVRHIDLKQRSAILKTLDGEGFETDAFISMIKDAAYKEACDTLAKLESNK